MKSTMAIVLALQGTFTAIAAAPAPEPNSLDLNSVDVLHCGNCWTPPGAKTQSKRGEVSDREIATYVDHAMERAVKRAVENSNSVDVLHCGNCWTPPGAKTQSVGARSVTAQDVETRVDHAIENAVKRAVKRASDTSNSVDVLHCGNCWTPPGAKTQSGARSVDHLVDRAIENAVKRAVKRASESTNSVDVLHCGNCWTPPSN